MPVRYPISILWLATSALSLTGTAHAQEADSVPVATGAEEDADAIIVTARRREESLNDVPIAVTVLTGSALQERNVVAFQDLQNFTPSLSMSNVQGKPTTPNVALRGIRPASAILAQDQPVGIYFAEAVVTPPQGSGTSLYDLDSVQVLKGPQGTLFGRNTPGGALLISPARPTGDFSGRVALAYGNFDTVRTQGHVNTPVSDSLLLRFSFNYNRHDGYYRVLTGAYQGQQRGDLDSRGLRVSAIWRPVDGLENYTVGYWDKDESNGPAIVLRNIRPGSPVTNYNGTGNYAGYPSILTELQPGEGKPRGVFSDLDTFDNNRNIGVVNITTFDLGGVTLKNIFSYRNTRNHGLSDFDGTSSNILSSHNILRSKVYTEEFQVQGEALDGGLTWVAGLFGLWQDGFEYAAVVNQDNPGVTNNAIIAYEGPVHQDSYAAYAQATAKLTDRLSLTAGFRYTRDERALTARTQYVLDPYFGPVSGRARAPGCALVGADNVALPNDACSLSVAKSFSSPTWTVSVDYKPVDDMLVYVSHRAGYRSGGFNPRGTRPAQFRPYDPEKVYDLEGGVKYSFRTPEVRGNFAGAVYHTWYKDLQKTLGQYIDGVATNSIFNAAQAKVFGFELEGSLRFSPGIELTAGYSYVDPKYEDFDFLVSGTPRDFSDRRFAYIPKHQLNALMKFDLPFDEKVGDVSFTMAYQYQSNYAKSETYQNREQMAVLFTPAQAALYAAIPEKIAGLNEPGRWLLDARVDWKRVLDSNFDFSFAVRNVMDKSYALYGDSRYDNSGFIAVVPADPRTYMAELTFSF